MTTELIPKFIFSKDAAQWATEYSNAIYSMSQSEEEVKFKNVDLKFFVAIIPASGCFASDEALHEILSRKTVIQIKNNDNNCFGIHYCIVSRTAPK